MRHLGHQRVPSLVKQGALGRTAKLVEAKNRDSDFGGNNDESMIEMSIHEVKKVTV